MKTINQLLTFIFATLICSCTVSKDMSYEDDIYSTDNGIVFAENNNDQKDTEEDYYDSEYGDLYERH